METFGDKMRQAIASRGMRLEDIARSTGFRVEELEALERSDHDALPDKARVVDCLRRLAECIDVEAEVVVNDYLREREDRAPTPPTAETGADETRPVVPQEFPRAARPPKSRESLLPVVLAAAVLLGAGAWWWIRSTGSSEPEPGALESRPSAPAALAAPDVAPRAPVQDATTRALAPRPAEPPADVEPAPAGEAAGLVIRGHGVGTGVADRRLVGRADRFAEGSQVWFWTDVQGGARGDTIYHVWLHQGAEATIIPLSIDGSRWRTQSGKTLHAGSAGNWTVEARDEVGTVLARQDFVCTAAR